MPGADDDELKRRVSETFAAYKFSYWQGLSGMDRLASLADDKLKQVGIKYRRAWRCQTNHGEDGREAPVHCVGVWDTVGAVGMPVDELRDGLTWLLQQLARIRFLSKYVPVVEFLDGTPPRHMQHGFHALAIDDQRQAFHPTLWKESGNPAEGAQVEQVWFAGMHSNVGGGYPKDQLALVSLDWMMDRVEACGVRFLESSRAAVRQQLDEHGRMYDSRAGLGIYYRFMPRDLTKLWSDATKSDAARPILIHQSVMQRISAATQGYAPHNLSSSFNLVSRTALNPPVYQQQPWQVDAGKCDYYDVCLARSAHYASWRRIIYMLLVGATLIFLGLITMLDPIPQGEMIEASPLLGGLISLLQFLLPDMLGGRLEALGAYEAPFWSLVGVLALLFVGHRLLKRKMINSAQAGWRRIFPLKSD
ncbi:phospholipase effector Tle1 domain-containing protein [Candidatus Endoriftia persephonae]|jgi:hypothetical protein|uniref:T6SS Phospholipase effector Tle1-like catalytic domain-containing protein n=2 Tax=sulfur-oxidizing symbionts TaxID=32036 RepID=G2FCC5_9GAMM|nr:DUF2235 domain-containing protein [Candidatus Endoriftia persephone]EGW55488.1 hypothetical protein TevJSym_ac00510 [endosymbiont of Tevnia jerichonana (vent Tica)]